MAETRERIVAAGAELLHGFPIWNWSALTIRSVAERTGLNERTVYRYFASERDLCDAVMDRLEQEAGVELERLRLEDLQDFTAQMLEYVSSFPLVLRTPLNPTMAAANRRQREALLAAVTPSTRGWPALDRRIAAAMLDVLWSLGSYELLVASWELEPKQAIRGLTWVIGLVQEALRSDQRPGG